MKTLAIDTSSKVCTVSILDDDNVLINLYNNDERTHSVKLLPMIDEALKSTSLSLNNIDLLACCVGPGSFTGVRIGIATVKAFADTTNIPVASISSLESLAYNVIDEASNNTLICSLIDAKNNNVYCGLFNFCNGSCIQFSIFAEDINTTLTNITNLLSDKFTDIVFVGDGSNVYKNLITKHFSQINIAFASEENNIQSSISIAKAGIYKYNNGNYGDSSILSPIYLKKSQAERALEEKIKICDMTLEDINLISIDFNNNFDKFWNVSTLINDFNNPNSKYFIAKLDDEIVGFAGYLKVLEEANNMNIATKVQKRNLGIASKLLSHILEISKVNGISTINLEVNEHNLVAIHLYEKFGFKRIGLRKKYYNNTDDAILMAR